LAVCALQPLPNDMAGAKIKAGDRVKLTAHAARVYSSYFIQRKTKVNWFTRIGTVQRVGKLHIYLYWDDRKSLTCEPPALIELAEERRHEHPHQLPESVPLHCDHFVCRLRNPVDCSRLVQHLNRRERAEVW
jgi:hypothetical protein